MIRQAQRFLNGLSVNKSSTAGVVIVTTATFSFLMFEMLHISGLLTNAYIGLILYLALPSLFLVGLLLIPIGIFLVARHSEKSLISYVRERFNQDDVAAHETGSRIVRTVTLLTLVNLVFVMGAGGRALHFMESARFCGTACHSVMNPEWTTYQQSPHARVACVECHVGEGFGALIDSKLNGAWQVVSATFNLYQRPIPTPVHQLRPARETCETCHWPDKFHGDRIRQFVNYAPDSLNTPSFTTLVMKIGTGKPGSERGSHWHVSESNEVRYASVDDERERMIWIEAKRSDGSWVRYNSRSLHDQSDIHNDVEVSVRTMDCIDCHNRATHIYEDPERAVDTRIESGDLDQNLPFVKRTVLKAILGSYGPDKTKALNRVEQSVAAIYRRDWPELYITNQAKIDAAGRVARSIIERNLHPGMNIDWNVYPSHIGHTSERNGCFRCHNNDLVNDDGETIPYNCTLCHGILALDSDAPFKVLEDTSGQEPQGKQASINLYLKSELILSGQKPNE